MLPWWLSSQLGPLARWVLLSPGLPPVPGSPGPPTPSRMPRLAARAGPPDPDFQFGRWLVTAWASGPAWAEGSCGNCHPAQNVLRFFCGRLSEAAEDSRCNGCPIKSVSERRSERNRMSDLQSPASDRAPIPDTPARSDHAPIADTPARASVSTNGMIIPNFSYYWSIPNYSIRFPNIPNYSSSVRNWSEHKSHSWYIKFYRPPQANEILLLGFERPLPFASRHRARRAGTEANLKVGVLYLFSTSLKA